MSHGVGITHEFEQRSTLDLEKGSIEINTRHALSLGNGLHHEPWRTVVVKFADAGINPNSSLLNAVWAKATEHIDNLDSH